MNFLYEKLDALREYGNTAELPSYIPENLNPGFELRPYQKQAFENFITYFEGKNWQACCYYKWTVSAVSGWVF